MSLRRRTFCSLTLALSLGAASSAYAQLAHRTLELFLSSHDPGALPALPNPGPDNYPDLAAPPEHEAAANLALSGSGRLWLWARAAETDVAWIHLSLNIDADGPLTLSHLTLINPNHFWPDQTCDNRWLVVAIPAQSPDHSEYDNALMAAGMLQCGLRRPPFADGYSEQGDGTILLGYFDATYTPTAPASIWLEIGPSGIYPDISEVAPYVQFGFGDIAVYGFSPDGTRSNVPEATFTPEFQILLGDLNCDGAVNNFDIDPFALALTDADGYAAAFPNCNRARADVNRDGAVNSFDIDPFVTCLVAGGCP